MLKQRIFAILIILLGVFLGLFIAGQFKGKIGAFNSKHPFRLGLDLSGGTHLLYKADTSAVTGDVDSSMSVLRDVIERRVNLFGVSEPTVQTETASLGNGQTEHRLSVELPGITEVSQAEAVIVQQLLKKQP
jgi:preprotein translocase subunit SecD